MLTWILIIFVLALIFGVIKVDMLKSWGDKVVAFIKEGLDKDQDEPKEPKKKSK